jgi:hypothetical protein
VDLIDVETGAKGQKPAPIKHPRWGLWKMSDFVMLGRSLGLTLSLVPSKTQTTIGKGLKTNMMRGKTLEYMP